MKNEHIEHLIPEYLEGFLSEEQNNEVEQHLDYCQICTKELAEYRIMLNAFEAEPRTLPSKTMQDDFSKLIDEEKRKTDVFFQSNTIKGKTQRTWFPNVLKVAAGIALLVSGYLFGSYQKSIEANNEIAILKEKNMGIRQTAMLSLMENKSASKRIQGVNYMEGFSKPDKDILNALTERMQNDENANVRLAAVNALSSFTTSKTVRMALIETLKTEKNPNIQIAVIHILVKQKDKTAMTPMKQLLHQKDTEPFVKEQIRSLMPSII